MFLRQRHSRHGRGLPENWDQILQRMSPGLCAQKKRDGLQRSPRRLAHSTRLHPRPNRLHVSARRTRPPLSSVGGALSEVFPGLPFGPGVRVLPKGGGDRRNGESDEHEMRAEQLCLRTYCNSVLANCTQNINSFLLEIRLSVNSLPPRPLPPPSPNSSLSVLIPVPQFRFFVIFSFGTEDRMCMEHRQRVSMRRPPGGVKTPSCWSKLCSRLLRVETVTSTSVLSQTKCIAKKSAYRGRIFFLTGEGRVGALPRAGFSYFTGFLSLGGDFVGLAGDFDT